MKFRGLLSVTKKVLVSTVLFSLFLDVSGLTFGSIMTRLVNVVEAAQVVIEGAPNTTASGHTKAGTGVVFIDDQVGYKFFKAGSAPDNGMCVYRKTTDGGNTWGARVRVDTQTDCIGISVWYDQWTPGDTGSFIHIATFDTGDDEIFYNRLDTSNDTLLVSTSISTMVGLATSYAAGTNVVSITKSTTGVIFVNVDDSNGTYIRRCSTNCGVSGSWDPAGTPPQGNANSWSLLMPLSGGDVMLINRSTTNVIRSSIWNGTSWSGFNTIDASAIGNTTYDVGMAATVDIDSGDIYLVYTADNDSFTVADHDLRTAIYSGGGWSSRTAVFTNIAGRGLLQVAVGRDLNTGDIYTAYSIRDTIGTAATGRVYYVRSTDGMNSWGSQQGPLSTTAGDLYGIDMNLMGVERLYTTWYNNTTGNQDIFGDTVADIGPEIILTGLGTQRTELRNNQNNQYIGGVFRLESKSAQTVSSIVVSETGSINAQSSINNVKIFYDFDTSAPYDCSSESYTGGESQFGGTVSGGFSGADGVASFTSSPVSITPTQSMCFYVVFDIAASAGDGETIEISIEEPVNDVLVSGGFDVFPSSPVVLPGTTTIVDPNLTQFAYHWRNDDGSETTASSATGGSENTPLSSISREEPIRLRLGIANQGSTSSLPSTYRLEYAVAAPTCLDASSWNVVGDIDAVWEMVPTANITDGANTTDISPAIGGVTNLPATTFISSNGGLRDENNTTASLTISPNQFFETEFSIQATLDADEGVTYCFRVNGDNQTLSEYTNYPSATISADVTVSSIGNLITNATVGTNNVYAGGTFMIEENASSRNVTEITITELGTINETEGLSNVRLYYDLDTSAPYNCLSESYSGGEAQYGATSTSGFNGSGGTATFSGSVSITTTSALCLYVVYDVTDQANNGDTISLAINSPVADVIVSGGGSVGPSGQVLMTGETTVVGPILTQTNYHWRNNNGNETAATSATGGSENTPLTDFNLDSPVRLRLAVTNTGSVANPDTRFRLEYSPKISTCDMATVWTDVSSAADGWDMFDSTFLTNGSDTTNILVANGGVSNSPGIFITPNGGVRDTESLSASTSIPNNDYLELEYSITSTEFTSYGTTYCFRVSADGTPLLQYNNYAEITTAPKRDYKVQRGTTQVSGTSATLVAGTDYVAPASSSLAFVRITNSHNTGAGNTAATAGQNADDMTAYISNPGNILTSFTITRPPAALSNTRVEWEIVEFIGKLDTDNEMRVRSVGTVSYTTATVVATGTPVSGVVDNSKVVVFVTGASNRNTSRNFYASQVTAEWDAATQSPVFRRGASGSSIVDVSYAVVEYTGANWQIQRVQHSYVAAGVIETENITAVNSLARTFLHVQKRMGATTNVVHFGHEVWLSSIGAVSFQLESGASVAVEQTSVAWVIENIQSGVGEMKVQRSNGATTGGTGPLTLTINLMTPVESTNNTSIMANTRAAGANTSYPRPMAGFGLTSTSTYTIWRSNTGSNMTYRVELIEWPVADLSFRQNYYRFYVNNGELTPTEAWPPNFVGLGENTPITISDVPLGAGDRVRVRMTLRTNNATMPPGLLNFKLQYGLRATTCSAIDGGSWIDVGAISSGTIWRGFSSATTTDGQALSVNPPNPGDLLISVSDIAGSLIHQNPSAPNPYAVLDGSDIEYDWHLEHNGAIPQSTYCFRVVRSDGTPLSGYNNYPQIRTAGYTPATTAWRWYSDINNETPTSPLSAEGVAPTNIADGDTLALRVAVREKRNVQGDDIKFKLQFSEDPAFSAVTDVVATSSCAERSYWCYEEGSSADNQTITTAVLSTTDSCVASSGFGCGTHNSGAGYVTGDIHYASTTREYSFTLRQVAARVNAVYYFRLYDLANDAPVSPDAGFVVPSLVVEGSRLLLSITGVPSGTTTAGVVTTATTTASGIAFGSLPLNTDSIAAHRLTVETNATEGYQLLKFARQQLLSANGSQIAPISSNNTTPASWASSCLINQSGCFGYHTTDPTLRDGSTRFAASDTYAAMETTPVEIMFSSIPTVDTHDIVYRVRVNELQPAGIYESEVVYLAVPAY
jgi:hypothetical protein